MREEDADKMSGEEFLQHIKKEVECIDKEFDIAIGKKFMRYEKKYPEIVAKFQEYRRCTDTYERLRMSFEILKIAYQLRRRKKK